MPQTATWRVSGNPTVAGTGTGVYEFSDPNAGTVTMILLSGETTRIPVAMQVLENTSQPLDVSIDRSPGATYLIWIESAAAKVLFGLTLEGNGADDYRLSASGGELDPTGVQLILVEPRALPPSLPSPLDLLDLLVHG